MILGIAAMVMGVIGMGLAAVIPILGGLIAMGLFFLGFVASVVGVVLGHKARGQIKRGLATSGAGMALTGIILGYVAIAGAAAMVAIAVVAGFMGYRAARDQMGQPPANVRSVPVMPERAEPARGGQRGDRVTRPGGERGQPAPVRRAPSDPPVTTDPASATIPDARASGTIGREPFRVERAEFNPFLNTLTLQESADRSKRLTIFFFPSEGESALGRVWTMAASAQGNRPHVHYSGGGQGGVEMNNYALRVEFGQPQGGRVTGKIFLELPNSTGVQLAGTFEATVRD